MKKLWNRARSRTRRQSESRPNTIKSSQSREHLATPPVPALPRTSQSTQRPTDASNGSRIRPVLVAVSKPGVPTSRPGTAGSLQNAVSRAADSTSQEFVRGHTRTKSPRYVDIFSASTARSFTSAYNEDIAERNLDTIVARAEQHPAYVPTSKYQEEVALRNSYHSSEAPRLSGDRNHRSWISSGTESGPSMGHTPQHSWSSKHPENGRPLPGSEPAATVSREPGLAFENDSFIDAHASDQPSMPLSNQAGVPSIAVNSALTNYHLSKSEVSQPRHSEQVPTRSSSRMSAASSQTPVINLMHRTIMDLTGESDGDVEDSSTKDPGTPHQEVERRAKMVLDAPPRKQQQTRLNSGEESLPKDLQERKPEHVSPEPVQVVAQMSQEHEPGRNSQPSGFSTISTLASFAPAATSNKTPQVAPKVEHVATQLAQSATANRLSTVAETESETDDGRYHSVLETPPKPNEKSSVAATDGVDDIFVSQMKPTEQQPAKTRALPEPALTAPQSTPRNIHTSPESLHSSDFTNPSTAFGVRTRDFAIIPTKGPSRADHGANTSAKVTKANATTSEDESRVPDVPGVNSGPLYSFDEDAFRRKQEQARAALVKLQKSLNEDFLPPPREQPSSRPNRMNGVGQRRVPNSWAVSDPHGPVAPSSIFTKHREQTLGGADAGDSTSSKVAPAPSVHTQVTRPRVTAQDSGSSSSTVRPVGRGAGRQPLQQSQPTVQSRARSADQKGKGRERDIDTALYELQRTAEEIAGPPRAASAHGRGAVPSLYERRAGSAGGATEKVTHSYVLGQQELKRPYALPNNHGAVPPSPGEVSLSNFPLTPRQSHSASAAPNVPSGARNYGHQFHEGVGERDFAARLKRRSSNSSQASRLTSTSQYSIPFHMIPERGSSMRDSLVREVE
ncbi:uncharacterized protein HMPREF1541_03727 [Cyphellophora europaea CBS 101466]|uniref:Uncharacterized protein n=1 Tax=Cyphellophora europaea (strain CBS 101466) TaxID=1220924 RepID=W2RZL4_CYPE1|nr:uncharacterized protein HMPREF1541_03727 [Cyphellophora europaea CBS 101466]ETN41790.1 hypothetical protein HMPREF1541_03727 [Cyphellophora europaea CBS 101466]